MVDVYYLRLGNYLYTQYIGKTLNDPRDLIKERLGIDVVSRIVRDGVYVTYIDGLAEDVIERGIGYVEDDIESKNSDKDEPQDFELTIRGKENIEEALQASNALSALGSIKEYLRGIEKWRDWENKNDAYELIVEIREGVNEIINDLKLDI